jgi:17beta-estradiol 17-dehydrogenase / very-long-chain 3-oxoacyl-CoA reductase
VACPSLVVTGASDGIGREFAIQLARAGFNVLLAARNQARLDTVVDDIGAGFFLSFFFVNAVRDGMNEYIVNACGTGSGSGGVQTKTFVVDFASADDARWEALLEELKPIEIGVLGASVSSSFPFLTKKSERKDVLTLVCAAVRVRTTTKTVNNVGVSHEFPTDFVDTSPEELATIINVNVTATLRITSLIAPSMASRFVSSSSLGVVS